MLSVGFPKCWDVIAQADERMRSEEWVRIRREIEAAVARGQYQDTFEEMRPWESVIRDSAYSFEGKRGKWWQEHVICLCSRSGGRQATRGGQRLCLLDRRKDGRYLRTEGQELCFAWNRSKTGCSEVCEGIPARAHVCEWCLGPHRAVDNICRAAERPLFWRPS